MGLDVRQKTCENDTIDPLHGDYANEPVLPNHDGHAVEGQ
jgi:hypothetical protein